MRENTLTIKIAERLAVSNRSIAGQLVNWLSRDDFKESFLQQAFLDADEFTRIELGAARWISSLPVREISLNGLRNLPADSAAALSCFEGILSFNGLSQLSVQTAEALASNCRGTLWLDGLEDISEAAAKALSRGRAGELTLCGLKTLSSNVAETLSQFTGGTLYLGVSQTPTEEAITKLEQAQSLTSLKLSAAVTISDEIASALAKLDCWIDLRSLNSLSDKAACAFAESYQPSCKLIWLVLPSNVCVSARARELLDSNPNISFID